MGRNTKAYLLSLLFLFLLVHTTVAGLPNVGRFLKPLFKLMRRFPKDAAGSVWQIASSNGHAPPPLGMHENSVSPPAPPPPDTSYFYGPGPAPLPYAPTSAEEIRWVKQYLSNYGYMLYAEDDPYNEDESLDTETISAIKDYQKFFNLKVTGNLDDDTRQKMVLLRCGVPDKNFTYDLSATNNESWPLGTKWFPNGPNLTYGFAPTNELPEEIIKVFRDSFQLWSEAIGLVNLTETTSFDDADIKIGFRDFSNVRIGPEVVGGTVIAMKTYDDDGSQLPNNNNNNVTFGSIVLVGEKSWTLPNYNVDKLSWEQNVVDLKSVVMHQIGHVLGLQHSSNEDSVMYPSILPSMQRKVELSQDDKGQIQQLYSSFTGGSSSGVVGSGWGLLLIITWSFGFACMVVLF